MADEIDYEALAREYGGVRVDPPPPKSIAQQARESQFAQNVVKSAKGFGEQIVDAVAGIPSGDTPMSLLNLVGGTIQKMTPGQRGPLEQYPEAVGQYYANRYGSLKDLANTAYTDPVGTLADTSTVLSLGGAGVRAAAIAPRAMGMTRTANALGTVGDVLNTAGAVTDPLRIGLNVPGLLIRGDIPYVSSWNPLASRFSPEALYQSAMKPRPSLSAQPGRVERMVETGLKEDIPVSAGGVKKAWGIIDDLNNQVKGYIDDATAKGVTIDPLEIRKRIDDVRAKYSGQFISGDDLAKIDKIEQKFLAEHATPSTQKTTAELTAAEAQAAKQKAYLKLQGKYGKKSSDVKVDTLKALARGANEELRKFIPEITEPNIRESALLDFTPELQRAVSRTGNYQLLGLIPSIAGGAVGAAAQSPGIGATVGLMTAIFDHPMAKSKLARAIYDGMKANPRKYGAARMATAMARADAYIDQLRRQTEGTVTPSQ